MVIGKGSAYGSESDIDPAWPSLATDAALAHHIEANGAAPCTVTGGDLLLTLGGGATAGLSPLAYPVDLLEVELDAEHVFAAVAHVVVRRQLWAGEFLVAMNAAWVNGLYLGPRAHPNDGLVDVTTGALPWRQRWMARRRAATGTHLPHPALTMVRRPSMTFRFDHPTVVRVDGQRTLRASQIDVRVRPDAGLVVV
jgi:diacylglycerol kinase family enzyme